MDRADRSGEDATVGLFIEADQQGLSFPQRGCPQLAVPADGFDQFRPCRLFLLEIEEYDPLAHAGVDLVDLPHQLENLRFGNGNLSGVDFFFDLNLVIRKKLLRFPTGLSSRSVIAPVDSRHCRSS